MKNIFEIQNVYCAYSNNKSVLDIDELIIPRNQLVFIIGPSGVGKSTMLEALGLMNYTAMPGKESKFDFNPGNKEESINFLNIWNKKDVTVSQIRNQHFSFIFQNTELMGNLSPFENAYIPLLIQGKSKKIARQKVKEVIEKMNMTTEIDDTRQVTDFSIGQRQRLAFVRAISPEFSVLFGDEPTGNLDRPNAYRLMETLKESIKSKNTSAIIVSHDLDLAIDFADLIILVRKKPDENDPKGKPKGQVDAESVFVHDFKNAFWNNPVSRFSEERIKDFFSKAIE